MAVSGEGEEQSDCGGVGAVVHTVSVRGETYPEAARELLPDFQDRRGRFVHSGCGVKYKYQAVVLDVIDGDTAKFSVRLGRSRAKNRDFGMHVFIEDGWVVVHESMRFFGINAAEHGTPSGDAATAYLKTLIAPGDVVTVDTVKDQQEKYGRFLATVVKNGLNVNQQMVDAGHAAVWDGSGPRPVPAS